MLRISVSPCSNPEMELEPLLNAYSNIGFRRLEQFTGWVKSAFDYNRDPSYYQNILKRYNISLSSLHLPPISEDVNESLNEAVKAAEFAANLGAKIVLFKAKSRELYIKAAKSFLDATEHLSVIPVLQNHANSPISSLSDFKEVILGINSSRMKTLLEVGHFHAVGVTWEQGYNFLAGSIALVHIKDQIGAQSVPFGSGDINLPELFKKLKMDGYIGDIVIEMEVTDRENTLSYLEKAYNYVQDHLIEEEK